MTQPPISENHLPDELLEEPESAFANFELHGNTLTSNVELIWEYHSEFRDACEKLLQCSAKELVLDLSHVEFIFSAYMGTIGMVLRESSKREKQLTIRIAPALRWLFEMVHLSQLARIEVSA